MIVSTKLLIPYVSNPLVARPRLMRKLNEGMKTKLTLVSAQAGYGKTTALSEWVKQSHTQMAWVSLDKQDNDWVQFWRYVIAAIQERIPGFGATIRFELEKGSSLPLRSIIAAFLNELNRLNSELVIILDDYHVIELPEIHDSLIYLLDHLPSHIHLYIASRTDLMFPTARLLAKGELHTIIMQDLRFQLDEGLVFFRETTDLLLSEEQVADLFHQTEGWISGLKLAAISLKRSVNIGESIQQFNGQQHHISDYLLEEVFHHQPEPIRDFLLETSILTRMNHSLCQAVTGQLNCQEQLERLEQLNLFVIPLDHNREWYRYHHLLSDFLQAILFRVYPDKWRQAHTRAAIWMENNGFDEEAVEHYLEAKQDADVVRLIEKNLNTLMQSKTIKLIRWVSALPENSFADKPMLELLYISLLLGVGKWEKAFSRVEHAEICFQALQGKITDVEWNQIMGNLYFFRTITTYLQKDLERTSEYLELVDRYMPEGSFFQTMGRNRYQGYDSFDDHLAFINDLHGANEFLMKWINIMSSKQDYPFFGSLCASYSKLLYEWNRLEEAEMCVGQVLGRQDIQPFARILMPIAISASRIQQAKGNPDQASKLLTELKLQIDSPDHSSFMLHIEAEQACLSLRQGNVQGARDWLQSCGLSHTDEVSLYHMAEYLSLARVLSAVERTEEAMYLLERLYLLLSKEDRLRDQIKVLILQSMTLQRAGQIETALGPIELALQLAEPQGYIRSFIDEGPLMAEILTAYLVSQQDKPLSISPSVSLAYVRKLLLELNVAPNEGLIPKEMLTEKEATVLLLIASGLSNKEIASDMNITGETVKSHIKNVYRKLKVSNRVQVIQRSKELNIL
ncbi:LuxR C-terminal-related transcriptional regulator [Cohnella abietis]|uniref:HTH luxR-type domain-containing protein n=1 Tax=Cohnella abietis TaxID=2507935 RepID=A0A3T1DA02_9BACL|nr:LuxR C-terminal-related transcriptional regulator [Cohnella abietis]BBI34915.1 hypothetical protein KCTCHS21_43140 [Cohnella abietis]